MPVAHPPVLSRALQASLFESIRLARRLFSPLLDHPAGLRLSQLEAVLDVDPMPESPDHEIEEHHFPSHPLLLARGQALLLYLGLSVCDGHARRPELCQLGLETALGGGRSPICHAPLHVPALLDLAFCAWHDVEVCLEALLRLDAKRLPQRTDAVSAEVHERAARQAELEPDVVLAEDDGGHEPGGACRLDVRLIEKRQEELPVGLEAVVECLEDDGAVGLLQERRVEQQLGLLGIGD